MKFMTHYLLRVQSIISLSAVAVSQSSFIAAYGLMPQSIHSSRNRWYDSFGSFVVTVFRFRSCHRC